MQKRLFGILASIAVIVAACGGATTSTAPTAPAASTAPGQSAAPVESAAPSAADLAADQILKIDLGQEPPTLDPNKAQDSTSIAVLHALNRGLRVLRQGPQDRPGAGHGAADRVGGCEDPDLHPEGRLKYSNGDPIVAGDFVYGMKRLVDPRTAAPYSYVLCEIVGRRRLSLGHGSARSRPRRDARHRAALDKLGVSAPDDKTVVVQLTKPATYFLSVAGAVDRGRRSRRSGSRARTRPRPPTTSAPARSSSPSWDHNSQIVLKPNPNWSGDEADPDRDRHADRRRAGPGASAPTRRARSTWSSGRRPRTSSGSRPTRPSADQVVEIPGSRDRRTTTTTTASIPGRSARSRGAPTEGVPDDEQGLPDRADPGDRQEGASSTRRSPASARSPTASSCRASPAISETINPYPFNLDDAKAHMDTALAALGVSSAADLGKLKFGFNTGAGHEPRVAFLAEAWRQAFGLETEQIGSEFSVFLTQRTAGMYDISPATPGAPTTRMRTTSSGTVHLRWRQQQQPVLQHGLRRPDRPGGRRARPGQAGGALQAGAEDPHRTTRRILPLRYTVVTNEVQPYVGGLEIDARPTRWMPGDVFSETSTIKKH